MINPTRTKETFEHFNRHGDRRKNVIHIFPFERIIVRYKVQNNKTICKWRDIDKEKEV